MYRRKIRFCFDWYFYFSILFLIIIILKKIPLGDGKIYSWDDKIPKQIDYPEYHGKIFTQISASYNHLAAIEKGIV